MAEVRPCPVCGWGVDTIGKHHPDCRYPETMLGQFDKLREAIVALGRAIWEARLWRR